MTRRKTRTATGLVTPKSKVNLSLTHKATETLDTLVKETGLAKSALFESILTGTIAISSHSANQVINLSIDANSLEIESIDNNTEITVTTDINEEKKDTANDVIRQELERQKQHIESLEKQVITNQELVAEKDRVNISLSQELETQLTKLNSLELDLKQKKEVNTNKDKSTASLEKKLAEKDAQLTDLKQEIDNKIQVIEGLNHSISNLEKQVYEIDSLQNKLNNLEKEDQNKLDK